ncbi:hypothetical protein WJX72_012233 [[Myrmecia] bisecta]|uniref:BTB domain-containing protein n=1 Tax=[Myrmecia] bisecta TaxID=41462 RepID=A0AAW1PNW6_9CHLO
MCLPVKPSTDLKVVLPLLGTLWEQGDLCDVVLRAGDGIQVPAHKVLLAAASPYWSVLLAGSGQQTQGGSCKRRRISADELPVLDLSDVDANTLRLILQGIYGQYYRVTDQNVEALLAASNYLEVSCVLDACCMYLRRKLKHQTCWRTLALATHYGCGTLCGHAVEYIHSQFMKLMDAPAALQALPKEMLLDVLQSPAVVFSSDHIIFQVVLTWVAGEAASRVADLPELLAAVRLAAFQHWSVCCAKRAQMCELGQLTRYGW